MKPPAKRQKMNRRLIYILFATTLISACSSPTMSEYQYNPNHQQLQRIDYSNYYELNRISLGDDKNNQLELIVITQLDNQGIPGVYSLKKATRYLDTRDYVMDARATLYLHNKSEKRQNFELKSVILEQQRLPLSTHLFTLEGKQTLSWSLGSVPVDIRLHRLSTRIEYLFAGQHDEGYYQQERLTQQKARQEIRGIQLPNSL